MSLGKAKKSLSEYSTGELVMFRFRKNKLAMFGVVLLAVIVVTILIAPLISSYDAVVQMNMADRFQSPNAKYLFGTDEFGRDLFARILYGGRISMFASLAVIGIAFVIGAIMGGAAGYLGGKVDTVLMRAVDVLMAVPSVLLAMAIITALGNGVWKLIIALAVSQVARFARTVRAQLLKDHIEAYSAQRDWPDYRLRHHHTGTDDLKYFLHGLSGARRCLPYAGVGNHYFGEQDEHRHVPVSGPDPRHLHLPDGDGGELREETEIP